MAQIPRRPKVPRKSLTAQVDAQLVRQAHLYAEKRKTQVGVIVEESLREYFSTRRQYLSDITT